MAKHHKGSTSTPMSVISRRDLKPKQQPATIAALIAEAARSMPRQKMTAEDTERIAAAERLAARRRSRQEPAT